MSNPSVPGLLSFFLFLAFLSSPAEAHPNFPGGCSALTGHGLGGYNSEPHGLGSYWKLEHDGGNTASPNDRVVVKLYEEHQKFDWPIQGFILKTSAGTLTAKSSNAAAVSACAGAVGHTDSSGKQVAEAYLDLPSSEGTVTVTAELVASKTSVYKLTLDIEVVKAWNQVGSDIEGSIPSSAFTGRSVSMNKDGTRMVVGYQNDLMAFQYDKSKSPAWQKMGSFPVTSDGRTGTMVSMSDDGTRIASFGKDWSCLNCERTTSLSVHEWDSGSNLWTSLEGLPVNAGVHLAAISGDGTRVALAQRMGGDFITCTFTRIAPGHGNRSVLVEPCYCLVDLMR